MPLDRQGDVLGAHPGAVIGDPDQAAPAGLDRDIDARRAGIESVLDEFLDGGGRPLDHLAGGDAIDENGIEAANCHDVEIAL